MQIINKRLSLNEFRHYVDSYNFGSVPPNKLVIHHTWRPTKNSWAGERTIGGLKKYYEGKGWPVGPHLFIAEDGIWLFSHMNKDGIHAGNLNTGSIGIEVVGDYDNEKWSGETKVNTLGSIKALIDKLNLSNSDIYFHRDVSGKSCPGWAITKEWLFAELANLTFGPRIPLNDDNLAPANVEEEPEMVLAPVPDWGTEAVAFVKQHELFNVDTAEDVRDAVKFYRFYKLINND